MKLVITVMLSIIFLPILALGGIKKYYPSDPDLIYVHQPSLFSGKWEKVARSEDFTEYIEPTKFEKNLDSTVDIVAMRNYFKPQVDDYTDQNQWYKSQISYETINCFNQTIVVNKMYFLGGQFASGALITEPIEPPSIPIHVRTESIGFSKIRKVCELANLHTDSQFMKSSFMSNI